MKKMFNKKFFLILGSTITLLIVLSVAMFLLTKENVKTFSKEGYIIASGNEEAGVKYFFDEGTSYKTNINSELVFNDTKGEKVKVTKDNFMHYTDGGLKFLKNGVIMDLNSINSTIVPYYNITNKSVLEYSDRSYKIETTDKTLMFKNIAGRISDNKYIFAGVNVKLQLAGNNNLIEGDYFEVTFVEDGIIKVENKDVSYQTTAQDSLILVDDIIKIDLGTKKIYYNAEEKMSLSQMTIDGNENIEIIPEEENEDGTAGAGEGDGEGSGNENDGQDANQGNSGNGEQGNQNESETPNPGDNVQEGEGDDTQGDGEGNGGGITSNSVKVELEKAEVSATTLTASFIVEDPYDVIKGELVANIINVDDNIKLEPPITLDKSQGRVFIDVAALAQDTNYLVSINEVGGINSGTQYFQRLFKTETLGIKLEKRFITENSLEYEVIFDDETSVSNVSVTLKDKSGKVIDTDESVTREDNKVEFGYSESNPESIKLNSNTEYILELNGVEVDNLVYKGNYTITKHIKTLKQTPTYGDLEYTVNEKSFSLKVDGINDPHKAITSITYNIYQDDSESGIDKDTGGILAVPPITKTHTDEIEVPISGGIRSGVNYRYNIVLEYFDNEKYVEIESTYSDKFLLTSEASIEFNQTKDKTTSSQIGGTITLIDPDCTIPMAGRSCSSKENYANDFKLKYWNKDSNLVMKKEVLLSSVSEKGFDPKTLKADIVVGGLDSSTEYAFELYADVDYLDGKGIQKDKLIGTFYAETNSVGSGLNATWYDVEDAQITEDNLVQVQAELTANNPDEDMNYGEAIKKITFKLYDGAKQNELRAGKRFVDLMTVELVEDENLDLSSYFENMFTIDLKNTFGIVDETVYDEVVDEETGEITEVPRLVTALEKLKALSGGSIKEYYTVQILVSDGVTDILVSNHSKEIRIPPVFRMEEAVEIPNISVNLIERQEVRDDNAAEDSEIEIYNKKLLLMYDDNNKYINGGSTFNQSLANLGLTTPVGVELEATFKDSFGNATTTIGEWFEAVENLFKQNPSDTISPVKSLIFYACNTNSKEECSIEENFAMKKTISMESKSSSDFIKGIRVFGGAFENKAPAAYDEELEGYLVRGQTYVFKLKFNVDTNNDGEADEYFPKEDVSSVPTTLEKVNLDYDNYILKTTENEVFYRLKIVDYDLALDLKNGLDYKITSSEVVDSSDENNESAEEEGEEETDTPSTKIEETEGNIVLADAKSGGNCTYFYKSSNSIDIICEYSISSLEADNTYTISLKEIPYVKSSKTRTIANNVFEGKLTDNQVKYETSSHDKSNILKIKLLDSMPVSYLNRISTYVVNLSDGDAETDDYALVYTSNDIQACEEESEDKCLFIDYAKIPRFREKNVTISIKTYYDSGIINNQYKTDDTLFDTNNNYVFQENHSINIANNTFTYGQYFDFVGKGSLTSSPVGMYGHTKNNAGEYVFSMIKKVENTPLVIDITDKNQDIFEVSEDAKQITDKFEYAQTGIQYKSDKAQSNYSNFNKIYFNNKLLTTSNIYAVTSADSKFEFNRIIPKILVNQIAKFDGVKLVIDAQEGVFIKDFKQESDKKRYYYITVFSDEEKLNKLKTYKAEIKNADGDAEVDLSYLKPETKYYFSVTAFLKKSGSEYLETELFDASFRQDYVVTDYSFETLPYANTDGSFSGTKILNKIPSLTYKSESTDTSYLSRMLNLNLEVFASLGDNYVLRYELIKNDSSETVSYSGELNDFTSSGSVKVINKSIDITPTIEQINNNGEGGFVFGSEYYRLKLYAMVRHYENQIEGEPDGETEVLFYDQVISPKNNANKTSDKTSLRLPDFSMSSVNSDTNSISFVPGVEDLDKVIVDGDYKICLYLSNKEIECRDSFNALGTTSNPVGSQVKFSGLESGKVYTFKYFAKVHMNNVVITDLQNTSKLKTYEFVEQMNYSTNTPQDIALGTITVSANNTSKINVVFSYSINVNQLKRMDIDIYKKIGTDTNGDPIYSANSIFNRDNAEVKFDATTQEKRLVISFTREEAAVFKMCDQYKLVVTFEKAASSGTGYEDYNYGTIDIPYTIDGGSC